MAQVLVSAEENTWYQGIANLSNYYEINLEDRVLKHKDEIFKNYYAFKCKFTIKNKKKEKAKPDLLLVSKNFKQWSIVELELGGKNLSHTKMQMRVFTQPIFDSAKLADYCVRNCKDLKGKKTVLAQLFSNSSPQVLLVFDYYDIDTFNELQNEFKTVICVFEIYKTNKHAFELYRFSGEYPFVAPEFTYLKDRTDSVELYDVQRPSVLSGITPGYFEVTHKMKTLRAWLTISSSGDHFVKIPSNPFPPNQPLILHKSLDGDFIIDII